MLGEQILDLARIDVLAAADDHVLEPAGDLQIAVGAHHPEITGVQPAFGVDRLACFLRHAEVLTHLAARADADLADLAERRDALAIGGRDLGFRQRQRRADGLRDALLVVAAAGHAHRPAGLGLAEQHHHFLEPELVLDLAHQFRRDRGTADDDDLQRGKIGAREALMREHRVQHRRHRHRHRHAMPLQRIEHRLRRERREHDLGTEIGDAAERHRHGAADMEHRQHVEPDRARRHRDARAGQPRVVDDAGMAQHDRLWLAGGAGREQDQRRGFGADRRQDRSLTGHTDERFPLVHLHDDFELGQRVAHAGERGEVVEATEAGIEEQTARAALREHVLQLVGATRRVDRDQRDIGERGAELQTHVVDAADRPGGDAITGREARQQRACDLLGIGQQLAVGPLPRVGAVIDQRDAIRHLADGVTQEIADRKRDELGVGLSPDIRLGQRYRTTARHGLRRSRDDGRCSGRLRQGSGGCGSRPRTAVRP